MSNYSAIDMTTAAAQGFRDGVVSVANSAIPNNQDASAAQPAQGQQVEPDVRCEGCGYMTYHREHMGCVKAARELAALKAQQVGQEPVAWLNPWRADQVTTDYDAYGEHGIPLYTAPQPAPAQPAAHDKGEVQRLREALDHIGGLSRALRVGGPDPMDLEGLSNALEEAVDTAHAALAASTGQEVGL